MNIPDNRKILFSFIIGIFHVAALFFFFAPLYINVQEGIFGYPVRLFSSIIQTILVYLSCLISFYIPQIILGKNNLLDVFYKISLRVIATFLPGIFAFMFIINLLTNPVNIVNFYWALFGIIFQLYLMVCIPLEIILFYNMFVKDLSLKKAKGVIGAISLVLLPFVGASLTNFVFEYLYSFFSVKKGF